MSRPEVIHLRHSSMHFRDPRWQVDADALEAIPDADDVLAPDAIGFTELGAFEEWDAVRDRARETGYAIRRHGSVGLAIHPRNTIELVSRINVLPALRAAKGSHRARGILEVGFTTAAGNLATVHEAHWITDGPGNKQRTAKRRRQSEVMADRVELHARGRRLSFWMGDTNEDEERGEHEVQRPLTTSGLLSIYDELKVYPATHGRRTIDVIGRYRRDRRVRPLAVEVGPRRHSDHRVVDAWYRVR